MSLIYNHILIYGYSTSGKAVEQALLKKDISYKIYDDNLKVSGGNYVTKLNEEMLKKFDLMVISPGVSIYNSKVKLAEKLGIKVVSELEFGSWLTKTKIIAITGTNGKTTTTSLLTHVLHVAGLKVHSFGNIGDPLSNIINYKNLDYAIVEVSSFQLEATYKFCPHIGIILNIDQDHIDRHKTFENYIATKINLFKNSNEKTIAILNADDEIIMQNEHKMNANKLYLSSYKNVKGLYQLNGAIYYNCNDKNELLLKEDDLKNSHTFLTNLLAVIAVVRLLNIKTDDFLKALKTFDWLPNRLEEVDVINEITFVNDSKATNIHASFFAILSFKQKVNLILGGLDKDLNFEGFFKNIPENVVNIILYGSARNNILKVAKRYYKHNIYITKNLQSAVNAAFKVAKCGEIVLFSPACASFDAYKSYKQRGEHFKTIVQEIKSSWNKGERFKSYYNNEQQKQTVTENFPAESTLKSKVKTLFLKKKKDKVIIKKGKK